MEIYVHDANRQMVGIVEAYQSFRWTRRYGSSGSFVLQAVFTKANIQLLQVGNFIRKSDDSEVGIIDRISISMKEKEIITVSGMFATGLLGRRIIWGIETYDGLISGFIEQLITKHLINPKNPAGAIDIYRTIPNISFITPQPINSSIKMQVSYKNLQDVIEELLGYLDVGIKTEFNPTTGALTMSLYMGDTVSAVFAKEYENIISQEYVYGLDNFKNAALIAGEGEGAAREVAGAIFGFGIERRELFVDARDLQQGTMDLGDYSGMLIWRGHMKLKEFPKVQSFESQINIRGNLVYKKDYDIGSMITIHNSHWNLNMQTRISEITESFDSSGSNIDIIFGTGQLSLKDMLKGSIA